MRLELEDEKKKNEDLQFKVEENEIMASGDGDQASQISEELQEKIKDLESQLQKSKSNLIDNQTEFQTKIKILESELEVQKKLNQLRCFGKIVRIRSSGMYFRIISIESQKDQM